MYIRTYMGGEFNRKICASGGPLYGRLIFLRIFLGVPTRTYDVQFLYLQMSGRTSIPYNMYKYKNALAESCKPISGLQKTLDSGIHSRTTQGKI